MWRYNNCAMQGEKMFALEEWVELANGCLCCSLKDDFLRALEALMEQRQRFDYILVETTGALSVCSPDTIGKLAMLIFFYSAVHRMGACIKVQHEKAQALAHCYASLAMSSTQFAFSWHKKLESLQADLAAPSASVFWVNTILHSSMLTTTGE